VAKSSADSIGRYGSLDSILQGFKLFCNVAELANSGFFRVYGETMLQPSDIQGLYAIIPTPAKEGAERADAIDTVDVDETARVLERMIADGINGLMVTGTTGECATLGSKDYETFVDCVIATVRGRIPTFVGTTALGTHDVVRRTRFVMERGATGILLGIPMWQPVTVDMAVGYYASISELFPKLPIMVYANSRAFRFPFPPEFWSRVVDAAPTVMAAKFARPPALLDALKASRGRVHFLPHESAVMRFRDLAPETTTACWSIAASLGPEPALAMIRAILANDDARAKAVDRDLQWAGEPIHSLAANPELFAQYNIQLEKVRINAGTYCKAGPTRPPYDSFPDEYAQAAIESTRRWDELRAKYAPLTTA
jgi:trans-o-hydroxybenzylidenepyruvate hydratase-aldolase